MRRRRVLGLATASLAGLGGCLADGPAGTGGEDSPTPSPASAGVDVSVVARGDQPDAPVEYDVEMAEPLATADHPARVRVTITNPTESTVALGEERAVQFHHVESTDAELYLHPAGDGAWTGPVDPGCWRLTEPVAVPEYYGTIEIAPGETRRAESLVYGHPSLPDGACLPPGDHRMAIEGVAGENVEAIHDGEGGGEFSWAFTLRVGESG